MTQAPVALTCGEPAGIGPDLAGPARQALGKDVPFFWLGDPRHLPETTAFEIITDPKEAVKTAPGVLPVLAHEFATGRTPGQTQPEHAQTVIDTIARAVDLVRNGQASSLCTLPIHKKALQIGAGFAYPGHTEYLAALAGQNDVVMMLASDSLRVVPITIHIPVAEVPKALTAALLEQRIRITHAALKNQFAIATPRLAVAGLNPHAGEGGQMGREEIDLIVPVLDKLRAEGLTLIGPLSADTMFHAQARSGYDVAICMYHDQALIPIKTLDFDRGVNVTLGLPFIRTSPDHGTALDIAGTDLANPTSTIQALRLAWTLAKANS